MEPERTNSPSHDIDQGQSVDHDRLFKELLTTFFVEFVEAFLPDVHAYLEPESIVFLDKEIFMDITEGNRYESDIVVQAKFQGRDAFFLLIVENQSTPQSEFPDRMFNYVGRFWEKYRLPIYPVALFSYDQPLKLAPNMFSMEFPGFVVIQFQFRAIQLNRLSWKDYAKKRNPAATALMVKMQIPKEERVKVRLECLRLIATLRLDPARSQLIAGFVRTYLQMTRPELVELQREVGLLPREEQNTMMTLTNEWIELGEEKGRTQGRSDEARSLVLRLGTKRFGGPEASTLAALEAADLARLEVLVDRLLEVETWAELLAN
ncbi:Rpn family recombination-promoting nuclease/putative transposase [Armatimonas sp.]|uniref:Rpn family recombination-promoting nuclease/putative transposase n=1 Tax=Armatimonas sp. TaxID=1872638 RepID=UPI00374D928C